MKMKIGIISVIVSMFLYIVVKIGAAIIFAGADTGVGNKLLYGDIIRIYFTDLSVLCALTLIAGIVLIIWHFRENKTLKTR